MTETSYKARLELDGQSGQWMADIEGLPVHTWGRTLAKVKGYAVEALAVHLDVDPDAIRATLVFLTPDLPGPIVDALNRAADARLEADATAARAAEAKAAAARALVDEAHLSMRDAAEVLGVSHQRVQQLLAR